MLKFIDSKGRGTFSFQKTILLTDIWMLSPSESEIPS